MLKLIKTIGMITWTCVSLWSCKKDLSKTVLSCKDAKNYDSTYVANTIIGKWKLSKFQTAIETKIHKYKEDLVLHFTQEKTINIYQNGNIIAYGTYKTITIEGSNKPLTLLDLNQSIKETYGYIYVCDNELLFENSSRDGIDYYYQR